MKNPHKWSLENWIIYLGMLVVLIIVILFIVSAVGCTWFQGRSNDGSELTVDMDCRVRLTQNAGAKGMDDADVVETVRVNPDCTTEIDFRQVIGDSVEDIEEAGVTEIEIKKAQGQTETQATVKTPEGEEE